MILSKPDITKELEEGKLRIEPRPEKIAQVSVNLRLGHVFTTFKKLKPHYPVVEITDSLWRRTLYGTAVSCRTTIWNRRDSCWRRPTRQ